MKTEKVLLSVLYVSIAGMIAFIASSVLDTFVLKEGSPALDLVGAIGALAFFLPFSGLQFALPSGLFDRFIGDNEIIFWKKWAVYAVSFLFVLPFATMFSIIAADSIFHFLPNFREAIEQGAGRAEVMALREQHYLQSWRLLGICWATMIGSGLLFREIFGKRLKAKMA